MAKTKQTVWVIMHYEHVGTADSPYIDSIQFHVASTLKRAETYIRQIYVADYSWWQVHPYQIDADPCDSEGVEVHYYSHRHTKLKKAPFARTRAAFDRDVVRRPEWYKSRG